MKFCRLFILLLCLLITSAAFAQGNVDYLIEGSCGFVAKSIGYDTMAVMTANQSFEKIKAIALNILGYPNSFFDLMESKKTKYATAGIKRQKLYIYFNPEAMKDFDTFCGSKWATLSVMFHEMHHLTTGVPYTQGDTNVETEMAADYWSGYNLSQANFRFSLGITEEDALSAVNKIADDTYTNYPKKAVRLSEIKRGWTNAGKSPYAYSIFNTIERLTITNFDDIPGYVLMTTVRKKEVNSFSEIPSNETKFKVTLSGKPDLYLFVNDKNELVHTDNKGQRVLGELQKSNILYYQAMLVDGLKQKWYIDAGDRVVNKYGEEIGTITK